MTEIEILIAAREFLGMNLTRQDRMISIVLGKKPNKTLAEELIETLTPPDNTVEIDSAAVLRMVAKARKEAIDLLAKE
ncbi:hypothetical protein [Celeribacter halophilus]|uniref:hypothetical protein n=1 Tax=Celeribacter halophilus TaxID=576117 RepID=UPI001C0805C4|nr:hypothetical protein [Celeribacter halophilus]MBU2890394.1 hypothetical protein [Celeribacter halophilus]MDO6511467.1 hypothetical protein [Celeribacter halophilus]